MTKKRNDNHSTEFGLWLREQEKIDSSLGFVTTNIDYIWENYKTGDWMLLEEKRFMGDCPFSQKSQFKRLADKLAFLADKKYKGFHLIQFEKTNPEDGKIFLDRKQITKEKLILFLQFARFDS
jgi:hypothetical protein